MGGQLNRNVIEIEEKRGCPTLEACQSKANEAERARSNMLSVELTDARDIITNQSDKWRLLQEVRGTLPQVTQRAHDLSGKVYC